MLTFEIPGDPVAKARPRAAMVAGRAWAKQTRNQIRESGQWPKNLPLWRE